MNITKGRTGPILRIDSVYGSDYNSSHKDFSFSTIEGLDVSLSKETIVFILSVLSTLHNKDNINDLLKELNQQIAVHKGEQNERI